MINLETVKALRAMKLPGMAAELESQLENPQQYKGLSFEDRLGLLVDAESISRRNNTIKRRIKAARLSESQASIEAIEYHEDRELDKGLIIRLATCSYIMENHHVVLKGATGAGKTYIANALGIAACRKLYKVRYVRLPDLLNEIHRIQGDWHTGQGEEGVCKVRSPDHRRMALKAPVRNRIVRPARDY